MKTFPKTRRGFTLIELLVVIAIIGVLAALTGAGIFQWVNSAKRRNSENTITAVYQTLKTHWNEVVTDAKKEPIPTEVMNFAGNDPDRARVVWIKTRLSEAFPIRYAEVQLADPYASYPLKFIPIGRRRYMSTYQSALSGKTSPNDAAAESSILILQSLAVKRGAGPLKTDDLGPATQIITGDGMRGLVDGWNQPIRFVRFSTGHPVEDAANPTPGVDPLDPKGTVLNSAWGSQSDASSPPAPATATRLNRMAQWFHASKGGTAAWYTVPVLISAGKDGQSGLNAGAAPYDDMSITNNAQEADNIYSFKLTATP